jgi:hypothetical protein
MLSASGVQSGENAQEPRKGLLGRGFRRGYGQCGSNTAKSGAPLVNAIRVPRRSGDRVGIGGVACQYARHQREWNVYRVLRYALGGRGIHSAHETRSANETGLLCEADRARAGHGRDRGDGRDREPSAVSKTSLDSFSKRFLSFQVAPYTIPREKLSMCMDACGLAAAGFPAVDAARKRSGGKG